MPAKPVLYLIDGSSQMYRAFHAPVRTADGGVFRNAAGMPTNAVYIFITMLRKLINEHQPQYIAASFDLPGRTFRDDMVSDYKANRTPMPDDLAVQIPLVHAACEALGVPILTSERYEADDVIGTLATKAAAEGFDVVVVTMDKDFFQLVHDGLRVFNPRDEGTWYDAAGVKEKFGVTPDQVVDVMALMGDTIDNIKGVPGIGEKGAKELIGKYGSLDNLIAHASELTPKRRETLVANVDAAHQSRRWQLSTRPCPSTSIRRPCGTAAANVCVAFKSSASWGSRHSSRNSRRRRIRLPKRTGSRIPPTACASWRGG
jgi:DNA polymerase-1